MKIRKNLVSNSSSSSFIVISDGKHEQEISVEEGVFVIGEYGEHEFGWQEERYSDVYSKINFCYIQAKEIDNKDYMNMLEEVLKEKFPEINTLVSVLGGWDSEDETIEHPVFGSVMKMKCSYIDHQSSACEDQNLEMFESKEILKNFLFNRSSYIQNDNDNH